MALEWWLDFKNVQPGQAARVDEWVDRAWALMGALGPFSPAFRRWRRTAGSRAQAEANPDIRSVDQLRQAVRDSIEPDLPGVTCSFFSGEVDDEEGCSLSMEVGLVQPDVATLGLIFQRGFARVIGQDEEVADRLVLTAVGVVDPTIGALSRTDHPVSQDEPYGYDQGWKMFFHRSSPHWAQARALATKEAPVAGGAVFTYGTPDTYPTVLSAWPRR